MEIEKMPDILFAQRNFFAKGNTKEYAFRLDALKKLRSEIVKREKDIAAALQKDLGKSEFEAYETETGMVLSELGLFIKNLKKWTKPRKAKTSMLNFPAKGWIYPEPYGSTLIFSAWNYPFYLLLTPLIGAIAAGNCAVLKPSELAPNTAALTEEILSGLFPAEYISIFQGGAETAKALLAEKFDAIFFTGGSELGRVVMEAASKNLTPVVLELGGKSPCVVDKTADITLAARRIAWGKYLNAGQTCVSPDYILVDKEVKEALMKELKKNIFDFFGSEPRQSQDYPRIVNEKHFDRLQNLLAGENIYCGGDSDRAEKYIAPTLIDSPAPDSLVMTQEIFGPLLPVIAMDSFNAAVDFINERPKPLALYLFARDKAKISELANRTSSGGICVNDTIVHLSNPSMPFGGVGESGMGSYHGKHSFDAFTHYKPVMIKSNLMDIKTRYAPYGNKLKMLKKLLG